MHFPIIELLETDPAYKNYPIDFDDPSIKAHIDYVGEEYSGGERKIAISLLEKRLEGIANVDIQNETITFLDSERIKKALEDYLEKIIRDVSNMTSNASVKFWNLRELSSTYKRDYSLFWVEGVGYTSIEFVAHAVYYAEVTFKIGKIYDAHF